MCSSLFAPRLILRLKRCSSGGPCAGLWLIANAFYWCWKRHRNAPAHSYHTRERHELILKLFWASFPFFLAGIYLSLIDTNSDPLLRTVADVAWPVRLLLLRDVASLLQSWCRGKTHAEITKPSRCTGVRCVLKRWEVVENDVPSRESLRCGSSSSWGGGLKLLMRLWILGLLKVC